MKDKRNKQTPRRTRNEKMGKGTHGTTTDETRHYDNVRAQRDGTRCITVDDGRKQQQTATETREGWAKVAAGHNMLLLPACHGARADPEERDMLHLCLLGNVDRGCLSGVGRIWCRPAGMGHERFTSVTMETKAASSSRHFSLSCAKPRPHLRVFATARPTVACCHSCGLCPSGAFLLPPGVQRRATTRHSSGSAIHG